MKGLFHIPVLWSVICQHNFQASGKKRHFPKPSFKHIIFKNGFLKYSIIRHKSYLCSCLIGIAFPDHFQFIDNFSSFITLFINFSFITDFHFQPIGKSIYNRSPYSVKSSGYFISSASEFSAGMKYSKDNFYSRNACLMINSNRNPPPIVSYCNGIIFIDFHINTVTESCQCFIYGIINNLIDKMMQSSCRCASDIHTGPFSYSLKSFQYLNFICTILMLYLFCTHNILLVLHCHMPLMDMKYFINRKTLIYKFIYSCTCNQSLNIMYTF